MNSQNHYHLTFNPRGPRQSRPQPHLRYVPILKNNYPPPNGYRPQYMPYSPTHGPPQPWAPQPPPPQHNHHENHDTSYTSHSSNLSVSKREEAKEQQRQKQAQIMRRVKELQDRVNPLVEGNDDDQPDAGFQSRIDLKLMRIESQLQAHRKEWEVEMERKLAELDNRWQEQFDQLTSRTR